MSDLRRTSILACILIVVLRLSIGWQFVYEGLWKLDTVDTPTPWSAGGYLDNAHGPLRDVFRGMTGDPNQLNWLDYDKMAAKWDRWAEDFTSHYGLSKPQKTALKHLLEGDKTKRIKIAALPPEVKTTKDREGATAFPNTTLKYDPKTKVLYFDAWDPPTPTDCDRITAPFPKEPENPDDPDPRTPEQLAFLKSLEQVKKAAAKLSYKQKLAAAVKGAPDVTGVVYDDTPAEGGDKIQMRPRQDNDDAILKVGDKQLYQDMIAEYNAKLPDADEEFEFEYLEQLWGKIMAKRSALVGPVKALEVELKNDARKLLTYKQIAMGPVPPEHTPHHMVDELTIWSLLILGILLLTGFATRFAAIAGAGMLMSFYMVWPPWPGVPEMSGPEHALFINKNAIEAAALLAIAALPTGIWFGLDAWVRKLFRRKKKIVDPNQK